MPTNRRNTQKQTGERYDVHAEVHLSKEFSKRSTFRERETKEHNASAYINEIVPRYGEPSCNPIELNCNVTTVVRESVTKLTLGETLHADVVVV